MTLNNVITLFTDEMVNADKIVGHFDGLVHLQLDVCVCDVTTYEVMASDHQDVILMVFRDGLQLSTAMPDFKRAFPDTPFFLITDYFPDRVEDFEWVLPWEILESGYYVQLIDAKLQALRLERELAEERLLRGFMQEIASVTNNMIDPDSSMKQLLKLLGNLIPYDAASIALFGEDHMIFKHNVGYPDFIKKQFDEIHVSLSLPNIQKIIETNEPYLIESVESIPDWTTPHDDSGWLQSWLGIPIHKSGFVIGIINLDSNKASHFTKTHLKRAAIIKDQLSVTLEAFQLYETLEEYTQLLSALSRQNLFLFTPLSFYNDLDELCSQIVETVVDVFGKTDCGVMLVDNDKNQLVRYTRSGDFQVNATEPLYLDGAGLAVQSVNTAEVVYAPDVRIVPHYVLGETRTLSELVIPLKTYSGIIGVLDLQSTQLDAFNERDRNNLVVFAAQAALAIENLQQFQQQQQQNQLLEQHVKERTVQLERANTRLNVILNHATEAILRLDTSGYIIQSNQAFYQMVGLQMDILPRQPVFDFILDDYMEIFIHNMIAAESGRQEKTFEVRILNIDTKKDFDAEVTITALPDEISGSGNGEIVCTIQNITKHKELEANLKETVRVIQANSELKTRFIKIVNHEFRTPLAVIQSSNDILRKWGDKLKPEDKLKHFNKVGFQINHLGRMLEDIDSMEHIVDNEVKFKPVPIEIETFFESRIETINTIFPTHHIDFLYSGKASSLFNVDVHLLEQIITNLLTNAVKYSPLANRIDVVVNNEPEALHLHIVDYGIGIPNDEIVRLFDPFFRARNVDAIQGDGLGLSIVHHAVERHQGTIQVTSQEGSGTHIHVIFPRENDISNAVNLLGS